MRVCKKCDAADMVASRELPRVYQYVMVPFSHRNKHSHSQSLGLSLPSDPQLEAFHQLPESRNWVPLVISWLLSITFLRRSLISCSFESKLERKRE